MVRYSQIKKVPTKRKHNTSQLNPAEPLKHARHEVFAQQFAKKINPRKAAEMAGYPRSQTMRAATRLMSVEDMIRRIQHLMIPIAESLTLPKLVQKYVLDQNAALSKAIAINPFTGEPDFDLARLKPEEIAVLGFTLTGGGAKVGAGREWKIQSTRVGDIAAIGRLVKDPTYEPDINREGRVAEGLAEIARLNITHAPINSRIGDDER